MTQFDQIIERWATIYKPMQHTSGMNGENRRFFHIDSIVSIPQFTSQLPDNHSPAVLFEFPKEGNINGGLAMPVYTIYFAVKVPTDDFTDKAAAAAAVQEAEMHAHKFLAWLAGEKKKAIRQSDPLYAIDLKNVDYGTYGPLMDNWYSVYLQIRDTEQIDNYLCVDRNDYVEIL